MDKTAIQERIPSLEERQRKAARRTASFVGALAAGIFLLTLYLNLK